jgi:hypothetical protein
MKRCFRRFRDDRFALTTLQNPLCEVRTYAELVQAAQQERENQPGAAQIPATQGLAEPVAPATVTWAAPAPPDPLPAALAPDFPIPDAANQEASEEAVVEVELTNQPTPTPRPKSKSRPKTKSHRKSNSRPSPAPPAENEDLEQEDLSELTSAERHSRKCYICNHPDREYIEEAFVQWRSPATIMRRWDIQAKTTIYHHAHAFNLFALRNRNLQYALGNIIEDADTRHFTPAEILDSVRALAHMNEDGRWIHPTSKSEVLFSSQRLPAGQAGLPPYPSREPILIATAPELKNDANH